MAQPWRPNIAVSLVLFIGGAILAGYIVYANGWNSGVPVQQVWSGLSRGMRALAVGGFIASAYGLGAVLNNLTRKKSS